MIKYNTSANVLEKEETRTNTNYDEKNATRNMSTFASSTSVSDDMMIYHEMGRIREEELNQEQEQRIASYTHETDELDINPTMATLQYLDNDIEQETEQNIQKSYKISPRGKIMITVYALVVATIIALIAMNARVLKTMEESIKEKEASVANLITQTQQLSDQLDYVSSNEYIEQKAIELGMTK